MEILDIVDESGEPTGVTADRDRVHREGLLHRTSHLWLLRRRGGRVEVLLQLRGSRKELCPSCYDISSAGHIPAGCGFIESALRELEEELGIRAEAGELVYCGRRRFRCCRTSGGRSYVDNQISNVYALWRDVDVEDMLLQPEEIDGAMWIGFEECRLAVERSTIRHCVAVEELDMLRRALGI